MPANLTYLDRFMHGVMDSVADEGAVALRESLSTPGAGKKHPGLPNRSSRKDQFPAQQSKALIRSIAWRRAGAPFAREFGALINVPRQAMLLELRPVSAGGRRWASKLLRDPRFHVRLRNRVRAYAASHP